MLGWLRFALTIRSQPASVPQQWLVVANIARMHTVHGRIRLTILIDNTLSMETSDKNVNEKSKKTRFAVTLNVY